MDIGSRQLFFEYFVSTTWNFFPQPDKNGFFLFDPKSFYISKLAGGNPFQDA